MPITIGRARMRDSEIRIPISGDRLSVHVKPRAKATKVSKIEEGVVCVDVAAPPEDSKANIELLKFLRRATGRSCRVISGQTSKRKIVAFD